MDDILWCKTTFNERWTLMEDVISWKTIISTLLGHKNMAEYNTAKENRNCSQTKLSATPGLLCQKKVH